MEQSYSSSDEDMIKAGLAYAALCAENNSMRSRMSDNRLEILTLNMRLKSRPDFPLKVSEHAITMGLIRVSELAEDCQAIMSALIHVGSQASSLALPANMESFILQQTAGAFSTLSHVEQASKNNRDSVEYKYVIHPLMNWVQDGRYVEMTSIVEQNTVKTVFFNWRRID